MRRLVGFRRRFYKYRGESVERMEEMNNNDVFLQTKGMDIVTKSGKKVMLKGVGLGGWMNMENFITGYPATESLQRKALRKAMGEAGYKSFFDTFLDVFFGEDDAKFIADH